MLDSMQLCDFSRFANPHSAVSHRILIEEEKVVSMERKSIDNIDIAKIKREIEKMNRKLNGDWKKGGKMRVAVIY